MGMDTKRIKNCELADMSLPNSYLLAYQISCYKVFLCAHPRPDALRMDKTPKKFWPF